MTTYLTSSGVGRIDDQLADLADGDPKLLMLLALAEAHYQTTDRSEQVRIAGQALKGTVGSVGQRMVAWEDLRDAVAQWHAWDRVADSQGRHSELSVPSREQVCDEVVYALLNMRRVV